VDTAASGAELATAMAGNGERGRIYVVEPLGPFEDDPTVTDKRFPGNVTQSYPTRHPLRVVGEVDGWAGHDTDVLKGMLDHLAQLRERGLESSRTRRAPPFSGRRVPGPPSTACAAPA
jgi:rifampin ADP-ribosylating transferase